MNSINLIGRLATEPKISEINVGGVIKKVAKYHLIVERDGRKENDCISCSVLDKGAEWVEKYIKKGSRIALEGSLRVNVYDKDGVKTYNHEVEVRKQYFC